MLHSQARLMGRAKIPTDFKLERAIKEKYQLSRLDLRSRPRRITHRPSGGAYVSIGWMVEGYGERVRGWTITSRPEAVPMFDFLEQTFLILDSEL